MNVDAQSYAIGVVLSQKNREGRERVVYSTIGF